MKQIQEAFARFMRNNAQATLPTVKD